MCGFATDYVHEMAFIWIAIAFYALYSYALWCTSVTTTVVVFYTGQEVPEETLDSERERTSRN